LIQINHKVDKVLTKSHKEFIREIGLRAPL
jgi:hypothetical protein